MKTRIASLLFLGLCLIVGNLARAEQPPRFYLSANGILPKPGDEMERTVHMSASTTATNFVRGQESVTNWSYWLDLKLKSKILTWDATNDYAKVEVIVDHALGCVKGRTNEFAEGGSKLEGTLIAGEWFFHPLHGKASNLFTRYLGKLFPRHTCSDIFEMEHLKLNQPRFIGESWNVDVSPDAILTRLNELEISQKTVSGQIAKSLLQDNPKISVQFVGTTNCLGFNCFELSANMNSNGGLRSASNSVAVSAEVILPFDPEVPFSLIKSSARGVVSVGEETNQVFYGRGLVITEATLVCRPVSEK